MKLVFSIFTLTLFLSTLLERPAYAYLDPGTGSLILQSLIGAIAGVLFFGRHYLMKLMSILKFRNNKSQEKNQLPRTKVDGNLK